MPKRRKIDRGVFDDQTRHAHGRSGGKQGIDKTKFTGMG